VEGAESLAGGPIVFRPSPALIRQANLTRFMAAWDIDGLDRLRQRAADDPAWFWDAVVKDLGWHFDTPYDTVLDLSEGVEFPHWFVGGTTNLASTCVDRHARGPQRNQLALIWEGEDGAVVKLTYRELYQEANAMAHALASLGVGEGDVVGLFLPMVPEAVIATYAVAKLGAVYVPMFSGYGAQAVATRLRDSGATVLICADGFLRRGRPVAMKQVADEAVAEAPGVRHMVVVRRLGLSIPWVEGRDHAWADLRAAADSSPMTRPVASEHPFLIIYTSGTTGRPKGAVHVHTGFPLKAAQDLTQAFDLKAEDVLFWVTDMGWMMGPWAVLGGMAVGATVLIYEGSPDYPGPDRLWDLIDRHGVTVFGVSPTAIRALMGAGVEPVRRHRMDSLRILGSTGEPWNPDPWYWYFEEVGHRRCPIINYSGGTEISGGILSGFAVEPVKACAFSGPIPGMVAEVVDEEGRPVGPGTVGELVLKAPWPGMTRGFWHDRERYLDTYWRRWPGVWVHGDWVVTDEDGFWYILGRSDDTIKVAGKRLGPAEAESAAVAHPQIREAAAIGVPHPVKGEVLVIVAVPTEAPGEVDSSALATAVQDLVAAQLGRALRPDRVVLVPDLPKTRNGKIVRRAVRAAYLGQDAGDLSSVENLDALAAIRAAGAASAGR
jgi:acetyl-CoA synthetase